MTQFEDMMAGVKPSGKPLHYTTFVLPDWLQGRTTFGGLSAALVLQAMLQEVPNDRRLRSMAVSFVGPVGEGEHEIVLKLLREGGSVTHIQGELLADGSVAVSLLATFGKDRKSAVTKAGPIMPQAPQPESLAPWPRRPDIPAFTQNFDMHLASGAMPLTGADSADFGIWMRYREPQEITWPALATIADIPPMPGLNLISPPGIGSSLTWYLEFPRPLGEPDPKGWWYMDYRCDSGGDGYFHNRGTVWNPSGEAILYSRQVATVFEK